LAVPRTKPKALRAALPLTWSAMAWVSPVPKSGRIAAESVALAQSIRSLAAVPVEVVALLIRTEPLAVKVSPSTPTRLASSLADGPKRGGRSKLVSC